MYIGLGTLLATVWVNLAETDTRIIDRLSVHFFSVAFLGFMAVEGIPALLEERGVMKRENRQRFVWSLTLHLGQHFLERFRCCSYARSSLLCSCIGARSEARPQPSFSDSSLSLSRRPRGRVSSAARGRARPHLRRSAGNPLPSSTASGCASKATSSGRSTCHDSGITGRNFIDYETYAFNLLVKNDLTNAVFLLWQCC